MDQEERQEGVLTGDSPEPEVAPTAESPNPAPAPGTSEPNDTRPAPEPPADPAPPEVESKPAAESASAAPVAPEAEGSVAAELPPVTPVPPEGETEPVPESPPAAAPAPSGPPVEEEPMDEQEYVHRVLSKLLSYIGIRTRVEITKTNESYYANIRTKHSNGLLIGRRGQTLRSLQYLTRVIVKQKFDAVPPITVDVSGYRLRRENFLRKKGTAVARIVLETHREMALDLLTEKEMELVVEALKPIEGIRVYAVGTGTRKNIIIAPTRR